MLWLYADALNTSEGIFGKQNLGYFYLNGTNAERISAGQSGVWEKTTPAGSLVTAAWAHWTLTYDGSQAAADRVLIYKDGVSQTLAGTNPGATLSDEGALAVEVGGSLNIVAGFIDAKIAHVRLWTATLTPAQVFQEMNSARPVRTADLVLDGRYDDATNAADYSGAKNPGAVTGALQVAGPPVSYGGD